jgi:hypothetical protein
MWPCLLERAWFKLTGSPNKKVEQHQPEQLFASFCPLPIEKFTVRSGNRQITKNNLGQYFLKFDGSLREKAYIFRSLKSPEFSIGLSGVHYFYLLDTATLSNSLLFLLRNPCGQNNFRGIHDQPVGEVLAIAKAKKWPIDVPGNFVINDEEFLEQIAEVLAIHYRPGFIISALSHLKCEYEKELFLEFSLQGKEYLNLCVGQLDHSPFRHKQYDPITYHIVQLTTGRLLGGSDNSEGCFGSRCTYLFDKFNESVPPGSYLIRIKKKLGEKLLHNELYLLSYARSSLEFSSRQSECTE